MRSVFERECIKKHMEVHKEIAPTYMLKPQMNLNLLPIIHTPIE